MRRVVLGAGAAALMFAAAGGTALAARPNNQACLGKDFSSYAQNFRPFGQVITSFAVGGTPIIEGGIGDEVQNHLAGLVPDAVLPNTCND